MMAVKQSPTLPFDLANLRGELRLDEPMSRHTSWRVGGNADYFYVPADREDVIEFMRRIPTELPVHWVGLGSNLLVRDGGVKGVVVKTTKALSVIRLEVNNRIYAEAGVTCSKVARTSVRHSLAGGEFLAGVPGSFGGALAMNAGAFGGETWPLVESIDCVDRAGNCTTLTAGEVRFSYRNVEMPEGMFLLSGVLQLRSGQSDVDGKAQIKALLDKRSASQPIQSANAGSVFKNPEGDYSARIIESLGLKGQVIGDACFSDVHANFIINQGNCSANDIEALIELAQSRAWQELGVHLEPEVRVIGSANQ
ncbi:MAG: UDP-N-acetylmuramate dehydrogenase [Acidiferrobacterales bacterium]|nr:UDP-N-acetylmuramate dehydrogenase [Acidiferrobacterales bacterium]